MKRLIVVLVLVLSVLASSCSELPKPLRWEIDTVSESIMPIADEVIVVYNSYLDRVITREQANARIEEIVDRIGSMSAAELGEMTEVDKDFAKEVQFASLDFSAFLKKSDKEVRESLDTFRLFRHGIDLPAKDETAEIQKDRLEALGISYLDVVEYIQPWRDAHCHEIIISRTTTFDRDRFLDSLKRLIEMVAAGDTEPVMVEYIVCGKLIGIAYFEQSGSGITLDTLYCYGGDFVPVRYGGEPMENLDVLYRDPLTPEQAVRVLDFCLPK